MHAMLSDHLERRAGLLTTTVALAALAILCREADRLVADATIPWIPLGIAAALMLRHLSVSTVSAMEKMRWSFRRGKARNV